MNPNDNRRPCPECGSASVIADYTDPDLTICMTCKLTFSPGTRDWPDEVKLANFNAHQLTRDIVGELIQQDPEEFHDERAVWAFATVDALVRRMSAGAFMEHARSAADYAGGTVFNKADVALALHSDASDISEVTEAEIAQVTQEELDGAASVIEEWIFNNGTDWPDALRDARDMGGF